MTKNKILAAAVAAALGTPILAMAQASTTGTQVQIYGTLDLRYDVMKLSGNQAGTISSLTKDHLSGGQPNKIGFRGTEALGGGNTAFFQVETQLFPDARQDLSAAQVTNATLGGRPTFLGMRGNWGELSAGYQDSPYKDVYITTWAVAPDNFFGGAIMGNANTTGTMPTPSCVDLTAPASTQTGSALNTTGLGAAASGTVAPNAQGGAANTAPRITLPATGVAITTAAQAGTNVTGAQGCNDNAGNGTSFNRTVSNSIQYRSPVIAGFRFGTMYAAQEWKEPTSATPNNSNQLKPSFGAYSLTWTGGPFSVAGGYEVHNGFRATNAGTTALPTNRAAKDTGWTFGGRWNYGRGLLGVGYEMLKYSDVSSGGAADNSFQLKNWIVEGTFNITAADVLFGEYAKTPGKSSCGASLNTVATATVGSACGSDTGAKMYSLGVDHAFSKRTAVYAYYSKVDNNASSTYNYLSDSRTTNAAAGAGAGLGAGVDSTSYNIGMKHTF